MVDVFSKGLDFFKANLGGFITSGTIAILGFLIKHIIKYWKIHKSGYTGWWEQRIYRRNDPYYKGEVVKTDYYKLKHIKGKITGELVINIEGNIWRSEPKEEANRHWSVCGYYDGAHVITLIYLSDETLARRGCIYGINSNVKDGLFKGYYLSEHRDDGKIDRTPLIIQKVTDPEKIKELKRTYKPKKLSRIWH